MTTPTTQSQELKGCPFCSSEAEFNYFVDSECEQIDYVGCVKCGAMILYGMALSKDEAIAAWNRRESGE